MAAYIQSRRPDRMNRRVHAALEDYNRQHSYHVYDGNGAYHGDFPSLDEARGCVLFDCLSAYQIIYGDWQMVEEAA